MRYSPRPFWKGLTAGLALALSLTLTPGAAATGPGGTTPQQSQSSPHAGAPQATPGDVTTQGWKSWLVKQALRGVADTLRGGGSTFVRMAGRWLDDGAERAIVKHSDRIADEIDDVANIPDIATHMVRGEVYKRLVKFLSPGTANVIANAVEGVMWVLL